MIRKPVNEYIYKLLIVLLSLSILPSANSQSGWQEVKSDLINPYTTSDIDALAVNRKTNIIYTNSRSGVVQWNGSGWTELSKKASGLNPDAPILTMATDKSGNVYTAGWFTNDAGYLYVARWEGSKWSELSGHNSLKETGNIEAIVADNGGNIYAAFMQPGAVSMTRGNGM